MLPEKMRFKLFDSLSVKTMSYVKAVPGRSATGLVKTVYDMIAKDFFINGSLTSHSSVPELLAGVWTGGRETILVPDKIDQTTKEAMAATLSSINDCPYCGDMLVSLVHSGGDHQAAENILSISEENINDPVLRERLIWVKAVATPGYEGEIPLVFSKDELPEAIGSIMAMSHINRFSHVVMDGSPVNAPFGLASIKQFALRIFGHELKSTKECTVEPGTSLGLLPAAPLPEDLRWASANPRIADALSRWASVIDKHADRVLDEDIKSCVLNGLAAWQGEPMPMSRSWVDEEVKGLQAHKQKLAKVALILAKAPYQLSDELVQQTVAQFENQEDFIRFLAWAAFTSARTIAARIATRYVAELDHQSRAA